MNENIFKVKQYSYRMSDFLSQKKALSWAFTGISILIAYFVFFYFDINDTMNNSILLIESIKDGQFFNYYDYAIINAFGNTVYTANYNLPIYIVFAIWNIPVYIIKNIWGLRGNFFIASYLWCKLLIVFGAVGCIKKIINLLDEVEHKNYSKRIICLLFASSSALLLGGFIAVQYDVLTLFLILAGMEAFIKNRNTKFILIFMLAVPFKMFSLFIFIPILLLKEKKVVKILFKMLLTYSLVIVEKLIYWNDSAYIMCMQSQNKDALKLIIAGNLGIGQHGLVLFLIAFIAVCVYCYTENGFVNINDDKEKNRELLYIISYIGFFIFTIFLITVNFRSYWIVLYLPFVILVMAMNPTELWMNFVLESIGSTACVLFLLSEHKIYKLSQLCRKLLLPKIIEIPRKQNLKYGNVSVFLLKYIGDYKGLLFTVFAACMIVMLYINFPSRVKLDNNLENKKIERLTGTIFRAFTSLLITCIVIYGSVKGQNLVMYNTSNKPFISDMSIMDGNVFKQMFKATDNRELNSLTLKFRNKSITRKNRGSIVVTITDTYNQSILYQERVGQALIESDKLYEIELKNIQVEKDKVYEVSIEKYEHNYNSKNIYPYLNDGVIEGMEPISINGEPSKNNLFMIIR